MGEIFRPGRVQRELEVALLVTNHTGVRPRIRLSKHADSWFHACTFTGSPTVIVDNCYTRHGLRCTAHLAREAGGAILRRYVLRLQGQNSRK
jgi:hypothetical protein